MNKKPIVLNLEKYSAKYTDISGSVDTFIENHFDENQRLCLFMEINEFRFVASSFDDFELIDWGKHKDTQLKRFTLNKVGILNSDDFVYELCNCIIQFKIPLTLIDIERDTTLDTILDVNLKLGKPANNGGIDFEEADFQLTNEDRPFQATDDSRRRPI